MTDITPAPLTQAPTVVTTQAGTPSLVYVDGRPYHITPTQPQHVVVQLPEQSSMSPAQRELMLNVVMMLVVAVVLCGCVAGVVVICGGTLMGLIGAIGANAVPIGVGMVGTLVAAGWIVSRLKDLGKSASREGR